jgi:DNA-binding CsgD family transcriptional regulator
MNKNEMLSQIKDNIMEVSEISSDEAKGKIKKIIHLIKDSLQLDNDWEILKKHFTEVHPNFFSILLKKYPELTQDELKLCVYLKIQLSSKEIARLINITVDAVNKRRNRMRKKLKITPNVDLYDFLINIES